MWLFSNSRYFRSRTKYKVPVCIGSVKYGRSGDIGPSADPTMGALNSNYGPRL